MQQEIVISSPRRTAIGSFGGSLKDVPAVELGAQAIRAVLQNTRIAPEVVDSVVMGNVIQAGNAMNPARQAAIKGGLPVETPAMAINRVCGSGAQAVVTALGEISAGLSRCVIAGGMENMERAPYLLPGARAGMRMGDGAVIDAILSDGLNDAFSGKHSGWHTEDLVQQFSLSREQQDRYAAQSQQRFAAAQAAGYFSREILPITLTSKKGEQIFDQDESVRPDTTVESLARLKPAFRKDGSITAGNAPGVNAGAAAMIVSTRETADSLGLAPMVVVRAAAVSGVEPGMFGLGPVPAIRQALARARWSLGEVDRFEINEAFAAIALAVQRELDIPSDILNIDGGAIAHGHPIGATGAILITKAAHALQRTGQRRAVVSLCIGGGQGIALCLEALA
ncbi:thiolase family protein [Herbaspirillum sp. VT-16-41]|uniref:thiolase family protein n=1 Tax=Herbaspirillum sp. VT-16-41 TaxID=1953765 RepID=UPI0009819818|nr:thiolase family protein [Herbaspirillum sp. VT-16-41]ONN63869.1 acetyl-CoA acetyltransferase [Herbaspirillum sp. VT-16-41]